MFIRVVAPDGFENEETWRPRDHLFQLCKLSILVLVGIVNFSAAIDVIKPWHVKRFQVLLASLFVSVRLCEWEYEFESQTAYVSVNSIHTLH